MRKSTIVVAILAATVASASAAPSSSNGQSGSSFRAKSTQMAATSPAAAAPRPMGAGAFTSARNAAPQAAPAAAKTAAIKTTPDMRASRVRGDRSAMSRARGATLRRDASTRRFNAPNRAVALSREVPYERLERPSAATARAPSSGIQGMVTAEAQRAGVAPSLAHAVVKVESMYNPRATGKGGYIGLMQLSYQTAKGMGYRGSRAGLYEPSTNLRYGMRYLAQAHAKAGGSTCGAVSKYQGGHGVRGVTRAGAVYCGKVRRFMASR